MNGKKAKALRHRVKEIAEKHDKKDTKRAYKLVKMAYKQGLITILLMLIVSVGNADVLIARHDIYPKELQKQFSERGYKLDLNGNDRDEDSWGFLVNEGSQFKIYTYKSTTDEELKMIMEIVNG